MSCLFCIVGSDFNTVEHIIPQSLGNDDLLLSNEVCDKCQRYLSKIENYVLSHTPIGFWRILLTIKTKKGNLPSVDFTKATKSKGKIPDAHPLHDNFGFEAHSDFTTELKLPNSILEHLNGDGKGQLKYVMTPKALQEIARFLGKIGLELVCMANRENARSAQFNELRKFVREGSVKDLWPIFHSSIGTIKDLFTYKQAEHEILEDVVCYTYSLKQVAQFVVFNLIVGTDSWLICLNDMYPTPIICMLFQSTISN